MSKKGKSILLLVIGLGVVGALGYYANGLSDKQKTTISKEAMADFAVEDTSKVDKIVIKPMNGGTPFTVTRVNNTWVGPDNYCIQQEPINFILQAFKKVTVKSFPPDNAQDNIKNLMTVEGLKVAIYENGSHTKSWIIGSSTPDRHGCYMLLEKGDKQSPKVVITDMPGFNGSLAVRFYADPLKWACTNLFSYQPNELKKIEIINHDRPERSFEVQLNDDNTFSATKKGGAFAFDTVQVRDYILNYKKVHVENKTVALSQQEIDSIQSSTPFIEIKITEENGTIRNFKTFRKRPYAGKLLDMEGNPLPFDQDRLWLILEDGSFARIQYFVFDKLFLGYQRIFNDFSL